VQELNQLLKQFAQMKKVMKQVQAARAGKRGLQVPHVSGAERAPWAIVRAFPGLVRAGGDRRAEDSSAADGFAPGPVLQDRGVGQPVHPEQQLRRRASERTTRRRIRGTVKVDVAKAEAWIKKGAHPSETVKSLLVRAKGAQA
jgi:hypothetical protein